MKFINYPDYVKKLWLFLFKLGTYLGCHQLPERSFILFDMQFPICARCTGVLLGEIISIFLALTDIDINIKVTSIFLFTMFFDWLIQHLNIKSSNNCRRFFTGILGGIGIIQIYKSIFCLFLK